MAYHHVGDRRRQRAGLKRHQDLGSCGLLKSLKSHGLLARDPSNDKDVIHIYTCRMVIPVFTPNRSKGGSTQQSYRAIRPSISTWYHVRDVIPTPHGHHPLEIAIAGCCSFNVDAGDLAVDHVVSLKDSAQDRLNATTLGVAMISSTICAVLLFLFAFLLKWLASRVLRRAGE